MTKDKLMNSGYKLHRVRYDLHQNKGHAKILGFLNIRLTSSFKTLIQFTMSSVIRDDFTLISNGLND